MTKQGFTGSHAHAIKEGKIQGLQLPAVEKLCIALYCTPNDLIEWIPEKSNPLNGDHPLNQLIKRDKVVECANKLQSIPLDKLEAIERLLNDETKRDSNK